MFSIATATSSEDGDGGNAMAAVVAEDDNEQPSQEIKVEVDGETKNGSDHFVFPVTFQTVMFQFVLILVSCHYSMIMTNWGNPVINNEHSNFFAQNWESFWIKISMQWLSFLIYFLSQTLPLCTDRSFD